MTQLGSYYNSLVLSGPTALVSSLMIAWQTYTQKRDVGSLDEPEVLSFEPILPLQDDHLDPASRQAQRRFVWGTPFDASITELDEYLEDLPRPGFATGVYFFQTFDGHPGPVIQALNNVYASLNVEFSSLHPNHDLVTYLTPAGTLDVTQPDVEA